MVDWPLNIFESDGHSAQHSQMATRASEFPGFETGSKAVWHCALHGTVSRCPWLYMSCEGTDTPEEELERTGGEFLHPPVRGEWQGYKNEHREWNNGTEAPA